jgi:hypothetical protein
MGRRGLVRFDYPAHQNPQVLKASEYNLSPQAHTSSGNPADEFALQPFGVVSSLTNSPAGWKLAKSRSRHAPAALF